MPQTAIFGPVYATIALTFAVWVLMYVRRIAFINGNQISPDDLAVPGRLAELSPPEVTNPSDNLKNLFEIPVLFYALALVLFATGKVDALYVGASWVFVAFRALHSAVHCTRNVVMVRFWLYAVSTLAVWFMAARAMLGHWSG
ncbi:MAG: MAPEG family protein [Myxococcota bacterium]